MFNSIDYLYDAQRAAVLQPIRVSAGALKKLKKSLKLNVSSEAVTATECSRPIINIFGPTAGKTDVSLQIFINLFASYCYWVKSIGLSRRLVVVSTNTIAVH